MVKASPNIQYQTNQYNTIIQNYYNEITENENEITDDAFEGYESEKEAVLGEPDKSINIVEDDIATDLEEVTGFFISAQILFFLLGCPNLPSYVMKSRLKLFCLGRTVQSSHCITPANTRRE